MTQNEEAAAFAAAVESLLGCDAFTLLRLFPEIDEAQRIFSTIPDIYPVTGRKPLPKGRWFDAVLRKQSTALFTGAVEIEEIFPDHKLILGSGFLAVLNIPIVQSEITVGSLNCLYKIAPAMGDIQSLSPQAAALVTKTTYLQ